MALGSGSLTSLREVNRLRIVDALRRHGTLSRADVARITGLSRSTVSTLVTDLQAQGSIVEEPLAPPSGQGRPPILLRLDASAGYAVGVILDHDHIHAAVADLGRTVVAEATAQTAVDDNATEALDVAAGLVREAIESAGLESDRILGVGVGLAGPVDQSKGRVRKSHVLPGWSGVHAAAELSRRLALPVHLDNDANLGALAEATLGAASHHEVVVYLQMSAGIGAGLYLAGQPFRGTGGVAGELGHVVVDESGPICRCGNRGCLETLASGPAVAALVGSSRGETLDTAQVVRLAVEGDPGCRRAIADAARVVGRSVGTVCNLLNPDIIVVGGDLAAAGELLLGPLREGLERVALSEAFGDVEVVASSLGDRGRLLGAIALAVAESAEAVAARIADPVLP